MIRTWYLRFHQRCLHREAERLRAQLAGLQWEMDRNAREQSQVAAALAVAEHERKSASFSRRYKVEP
jgi:hypothetical protein